MVCIFIINITRNDTIGIIDCEIYYPLANEDGTPRPVSPSVDQNIVDIPDSDDDNAPAVVDAKKVRTIFIFICHILYKQLEAISN